MNKKENWKQETAIKENVESSHSLIYMFTAESENARFTIKVKGKLNERDWAILDTVFTNFISQDNYKALKETPYNTEELGGNDLELLAKRRDLLKPLKFNCIVAFTGQQVRKTLGDKNFTDKEIAETMEELRGKLNITLESVKLWKEENRFKEITCNMSFIRKTAMKKTGRIAPKTKDIQYEFQVLLEDEATLLFSNDAIKKNFFILDDTFRGLKKSNRKIIRWLSLWQDSNISLKHFAEIQGWKMNLSRLRNYIERVEETLKEIKNEGYIMDWWRIKDDQGIETRWEIRGIKTGICKDDLLKNEKEQRKYALKLGIDLNEFKSILGVP